MERASEASSAARRSAGTRSVGSGIMMKDSACPRRPPRHSGQGNIFPYGCGRAGRRILVVSHVGSDTRTRVGWGLMLTAIQWDAGTQSSPQWPLLCNSCFTHLSRLSATVNSRFCSSQRQLAGGPARNGGYVVFTRKRAPRGPTLITIVLADPQDLVRSGIRCLLEVEPDFKISGEVADGVEAVSLVQRLKPRVLIVALGMPGLTCLEITRRVQQHSPGTAVIVLSTYSNEQYVIQALKNGASGYVMMYVSPGELMHGIRKVVEGHHYLSRPLAER